MTDERADGDEEQSEESSDAEVIDGDADDSKDTVAHDMQMRNSPSFFPENTQVCVETDVNRPKEKSIGHGGDSAAVNSANSYSSDTSSLRRGAQEFWVTSLRDLVHRGGKLSGGQTRRSDKVAFQEYLSDVCDEVVNDEEHKNQCGLHVSVMESRLSPSPALNRIPCSRHERRPQQSPQFPRTPRQSLLQGRQPIQEVPVPMTQLVMQIVERPLGLLEAIIDKELQRSCVEKSERVLAVEAIADSSTEERKVRQQVEQRLKERKQLKVQNWRERWKRWSHVSDDDSKRQAVKSNDFLYIGQRKLTVTVCPRCKAVCRSWSAMIR